jgi:hypothetical protein
MLRSTAKIEMAAHAAIFYLRAFTNHGSAQDLYSSAGLVAPCRKYDCVPNDGHAEAEKECCHDSERCCCEMQRQLCCTESGQAVNGICKYRSRSRAANAVMQDDHDTRVNNRKDGKHAGSRRTNSEA